MMKNSQIMKTLLTKILTKKNKTIYKSMKVCRTVKEFTDNIDEVKKENKTIGIVPTMGALHDGHKSLFNRAKKENDVLVCSVFVNPIQFNNKEDYKKYPRDEKQDLDVLEECGCDIAFVPSEKEVYKDEPTEHYTFGALEQVMEGKQRPGHFNGVATIVNRLFMWSKADRGYFGEKDFQQIAIIRDLVRQKNIPIEIIACPIHRDSDGLATSSRNKRLSPKAREIAPKIHQILERSKTMKDDLNISQIKSFVETEFKRIKEFELEYYMIVDDKTLQPINVRKEGEGVVGCVAVWLDGVRLIDIERYY